MKEARSNAKSCLFNDMKDTAIIRHYQTKAKVEPVVKDVMVNRMSVRPRVERIIKPTSYKKVK